MADYVSVLTGGTNNFATTSEHLNSLATDILSDGVVGAVYNTAGVAPMTGGLASNAQGTPNMTIAVTAGKAYITATPSGQASQRLRANIAAQNVTISANSTGGTRYDWVYVKIDAANAANPNAAGDNVATLVTSRSTSASTDNGTPPTYGYCIAVVTVSNGATSIVNGNIADKRSATVATNNSSADGWSLLSSVPNTVTYNGNRNYDLVFNSVDLSSTISPGQKLKLTRTVAAPDQCTDLESGSSQYYSKTSPAGLTFTTTFTCMAWVKLESYGDMGIIARRNVDTEGFSLGVDSSGRVTLAGLRIASNNKSIRTYASLPLNKWVHVAATMDMSAGDTSVQKIWFDGVEVSREYTLTGTATALVQGTTALVVGALKSAGTNPFDGKIAQAAVFSSQLTEANVRAYQSQGLSGSESTLVSAYSFDNSINDLNTTNANNLTANGSAVATNADSPFANAVTAGLEEYAEINNVTFSTNTTVNVRVPETCMIPTSGGISNTYYAVGYEPYGLPYFTKVLAESRLGTSTGTTSSASFSVINGMLVTFYAPKDSKIKISYRFYGISNSLAGNGVYVQLYQGTSATGGAYGQTQYTPYSNGVGASLYSEEIFTLTAGSYTFNLSWGISPGGTASFAAGAPQAMPFLKVELS